MCAEPSVHRDEGTVQLLCARTGDGIPFCLDELAVDNLSNETVAGLRIHPDVLFALGLVEAPAPSEKIV